MSRDDLQYSKMTPAELHEEYLLLLRKQNRIKKNMSAKSKQEQINEDKERGFTTHFAGANASETTKTRKKKIATGTGNFNLEDVTAPKTEKGRRRWSNDKAGFQDGIPSIGGEGDGRFHLNLGDESRRQKSARSNRRWSLDTAGSDQDEDTRDGSAAEEPN